MFQPTRKRSITPTRCEHVSNLLPLDVKLLQESLRFQSNSVNCSCEEPTVINIQLCLKCGTKFCKLHSNHNEDNPTHDVYFDIVSTTCYCRKCDQIVSIENIMEILHSNENHIYGVGLRGLQNCGNTCFMNSVWQALSHTNRFRDEVLRVSGEILEEEFQKAQQATATARATGSKKKLIQPNKITSLFMSYANLVYGLWEQEIHPPVNKSSTLQQDKNTQIIDTKDLYNLVKQNIPIFGDSYQHDAHEFLRTFSDMLQLEQSWTSDVFCGSLLSEVSCLRCNRVTRKVDPCLDLSLDFPSENLIPLVIGKESGTVESARCLRLNDCLKYFSRIEKLNSNGNEEDTCKVCAASDEDKSMLCTKRFRLLSMPRVLVIHFKRFKWSYNTTSSKISRYVQFPLKNFKLKEFMAKDSSGANFEENEEVNPVYDLVSVVVHHGRAMGNGHYTAYSLNAFDQRWYHFNDTVISPVDDEVVARSEAYLLFYEQINAT